MCGIFGLWSRAPISNLELSRTARIASASLATRGPDGTGVLCISDGRTDFFSGYLPERLGSSDIILLHRRLAIIDLSDRSLQPMVDSTGRYWISYNGEVYNYRALRQELMERGVQFRTTGDTEVILEGWRVFGQAIVDRIVGMFAFAIYDNQERSLTLVRDRVGIKPLYYVTAPGQVVAFASDQTTLLRTRAAPAQPNWNGVLSGMHFRGAVRPETVHRGMRAVPPGTLIEFKVGSQRARCYWDLQMRDLQEQSEQEILDASRRLLATVVTDSLVSETEVGSLMSGGIDSTTMSAIARNQLPRLKAYTLCIDGGEDQDEFRKASAVASRNKIEHHIVRLGAGSSSFDLLEMFDVFEEPIGFLEPHLPMANAIRGDGIRVVLNGLGPDELLAGYGYYRALRGRWMNVFLRYLPDLKPEKPGKVARAIAMLQAPNLPTAYTRGFGGTLWGFADNVLDPELIDRGFDPIESAISEFPAVWTFQNEPIKLFSYLDLKMYIGTHHNHTSDRFLMQKSIEGRFPFLDHRWIEFCFNLPDRYKLRGGTQKWLLRQLALPYLGTDVMKGKKKGFGIPPLIFTAAPEDQQILVSLVRALDRRGIVRQNVISNVLRDWRKDSLNVNRMLYLANLERWISNLESY
jgi:asparagine synthase (glutamine-hydrolysing)